LFYDSDGVGGTAAIQCTQVAPGLAPTNLELPGGVSTPLRISGYRVGRGTR
jgi:hypothetical protein